MTTTQVVVMGCWIGFILVRAGRYMRSRTYRDLLEMIERQRKEDKEREDNWNQHVQ